jgi:uncharacterized protein YceK
MRGLALIAMLVLVLPLGGCQTLRSYLSGCPGVYSGVRYFADQYDWLPLDGKVFFAIDLPISAVADTLALPVTFFVDPPLATQRGLPRGCRWIEH